MNICIIPARGGSKRIPNKNIRLFRGQPILAWSIQAAKEADCFDSIVVSTDDQNIADIAQKYGAEVPFLRPAELSDDFTLTKEVIQHAIKFLGLNDSINDSVCCLYATAPFTQAGDLKKSRDLLSSSSINTTVFTATSFPFPVQRAIRIDSEGYSQAIDSSAAACRSQDLEPLFHDAGQFYWAKVSTWGENTNIFDTGLPLILPRWRVQDIDTEEDWTRAELMHATLFPSHEKMEK
ncbi:pseudaminic acid cytidylyltransferase [Synechococcus sp. MU1611]|uniref:pseudaminic acid cytidylyltransferase n=1 Tax=Synechococcus sp. MU1611 TaxID=2508345 RepID=UPI001CF8CFE5|nr:pseudaminic acid cytidylyltransferase [Synechococcus sp. MU1611]MCB4412107.1 pseudaminic acid cytidylyltransferase [Synechococcus sp. MU1611]